MRRLNPVIRTHHEVSAPSNLHGSCAASSVSYRVHEHMVCRHQRRDGFCIVTINGGDELIEHLGTANCGKPIRHGPIVSQSHARNGVHSRMVSDSDTGPKRPSRTSGQRPTPSHVTSPKATSWVFGASIPAVSQGAPLTTGELAELQVALGSEIRECLWTNVIHALEGIVRIGHHEVSEEEDDRDQ